jgi:tetratricopeptide (TPR) repeat protein
MRVSTLLAALPRGVALDAFRDFLILHSRPDPDRWWAASGELGTVGDRIVDLSSLTGEFSRLAQREAERVARLHTVAARAIGALQEGDPETAFSLFLEQGEAEEKNGRTAEAEGWYLSAYGMARDAGVARAPTALRMAARSARTLGHLDTAAERYEVAWREAEAMGSEQDRIVAATGRGNVAVDQGRWGEALEWYERGLALLSEIRLPRRERWQLLQNLAIVYRRSGKLKEAREFLARAEREGERIDDPDAAVEIGNGWGQLLLAEGDPRGAELFFRRALDVAETPRARVAIQVNLGEALLLQRRALEAGECAREAEADAIAGSVIAKLPEVYRLLAAVARERGESDAFVLLEEGLALIRERELPPFEEALTLEALGELHDAEGERDRGLEEAERAAEIYREIGMTEASERLRRARENR